MKKSLAALFILLFASIITFAIVNNLTQQEEETAEEGQIIVEEGGEKEETRQSYSGVRLASNYYEFSETDHQLALENNQPIFLFFYANWCPTCRLQDPIVKQLMEEISSGQELSQFVAFRVNFNDNATDPSEKSLAQKMGVRYQHTMFVLDSSGEQKAKFLSRTSKESLLQSFREAI